MSGVGSTLVYTTYRRGINIQVEVPSNSLLSSIMNDVLYIYMYFYFSSA
jgi:hypothetical protein